MVKCPLTVCLMNADGGGPLVLGRGFNDRGTAQSLWVRNSRPGDSFEEGHQTGAAERVELCQIGDASPWMAAEVRHSFPVLPVRAPPDAIVQGRLQCIEIPARHIGVSIQNQSGCPLGNPLPHDPGLAVVQGKSLLHPSGELHSAPALPRASAAKTPLYFTPIRGGD